MRWTDMRARASAYVDLIRLVTRTDPPRMLLLALVVAARSLSPFVFAIAAAEVVAKVPATVRQGLSSHPGRQLLVALTVMGAAFAVQQVSPGLQLTVADALGRRFNSRLDRRLMSLAMQPRGIGHLEDPVVSEQLAAARAGVSGWPRPGDAVSALGGRVALHVALWSGSLLLLVFHVWAALLLLASALLLQNRLARAMAEMGQIQVGRATAMRETAYLRDLALLPSAAKEVRIFRLGHWLVDRHLSAWRRVDTRLRAEQQRGQRDLQVATVLMCVTLVVVIAVLARQVAGGTVGLATVAITLQGVALVARSVGDEQSVRDGMLLGYAMGAVAAATQLEQRIAALAPRMAGERSAAGLPAHEVRFSGVRFGYPGTDREVLRGLDLVIPAGESLGIVGLNGAGKTTLIKLLCRLYEPTGGAISVDGADLRDFAPETWQQQVAAIFQDYVHYPLTAAENVAVVGRDDERLARAAEAAGLTGVVGDLPAGWETVLSPQLRDGVDVSGGQWQRFALARAMYAAGGGATVLVLDEPTANLDIRGEAEIYDRFLDMTRGLTTVLISHRLSSVRRARRIAVIEDGRVVELGAHDELMAKGGRYAELFALQAAAFREEEADVPAEVTS